MVDEFEWKYYLAAEDIRKWQVTNISHLPKLTFLIQADEQPGGGDRRVRQILQRLELSNLNNFFDHDVRASSSSSPGVLHTESTSVHPSARVITDGPIGHRSANDHRNCGYGRVYTHDPVKGMIPTPPSMSRIPVPIESTPVDSARFSSDSRIPLDKLHKMNFPTFDGKNPKLWQPHCENYFKMYVVKSSVWVHIATMHFQGPAALWLQYINHCVRSATWKELCSWLHDRFCWDQHDSLIRQLFHIR
jgi:hypothetical protein